MMTFFYVLLVLLCFFSEISEKVNTDNIVKKLGLGLIMVGALIRIYTQTHPIMQANHLIAIGAFLYLCCQFGNEYKTKIIVIAARFRP